MGYRKLPFGYTMEQGEIKIAPHEAELVRRIFDSYLAGLSLKALTEELKSQSIPFDEGKPWNKNMIARLIADPRYVGEKCFPVILNAETYFAAQEYRKSKPAPIQRTEAAKVIKQLSGHVSTNGIETQVLSILNSLIADPERIKCSSTSDPTLVLLRQRLDEALTRLPIDEEAVNALIKECATAAYGSMGPDKYETERLRHIVQDANIMEKLDAELTRSVVAKICIRSDGTLTLQLKNLQTVGLE